MAAAEMKHSDEPEVVVEYDNDNQRYSVRA